MYIKSKPSNSYHQLTKPVICENMRLTTSDQIQQADNKTQSS